MKYPCEKCEKAKLCAMLDFDCEPRKQYDAEQKLYKEIAQLAYDIVLETMREGSEKHGTYDWRKTSINEHIKHALEHIQRIGETDENHLAHAITRLVLVGKLLEEEKIFFEKLKKTGRNLENLLNITTEDIQKALNELREEWK